jgi:hypothetical protein
MTRGQRGWLDLRCQGRAPFNTLPACPGAPRTLPLSRAWKRERGTSEGCKASAAAVCSAMPLRCMSCRWCGDDLLSRTRFLYLTISPQLLQQRLGLLEVSGGKALGEPAVDGCQQLVGLGPLALLLPQAAQARRHP